MSAAKKFEKLEEQLCAFASDGYTGKGSPDRADAMVWGLSELMLGSGTVQMFPDFRARRREKDPTNALHVAPKADLKDWWPRWVSVTAGRASAAHWWCREPSGRLRVYREFVAMDLTPEEFGSEIAKRSEFEAAAVRMVPVWLNEAAFERTNGKSVAHSIAEGISRSIGAHKAFMFVHNDAERDIADPGMRMRALQTRLDRMPKGVLTVQALRGKDQNGWDVVRELLRWRPQGVDAKPEAPDWDYARSLVEDMPRYMEYMRQFSDAPKEVLPLLLISEECPALIQAMSGAVRSEKDDSALAQGGAAFVLQSLRVGALASRESEGTEPASEFIGKRLERIGEDASPISKHLAAVKAEGDWNNRFGGQAVTFARVRRPGR